MIKFTDSHKRNAEDVIDQGKRALKEAHPNVWFSLHPDFGAKRLSVVIESAAEPDIKNFRAAIPKTWEVKYSKNMPPLRMTTQIIGSEDKAYKKFQHHGMQL